MRFINAFIFSNNPWIRFSRHFIFWAVDLINYLLVVSINGEITAGRVYRLIFTMPLIALVTYFILYYVIPSISKHKSKITLVLWFVACFLYVGIGVRYYTYYIIAPVFDPNISIPDNTWDFRRILGEVFSWGTVMCMAIAIKLIKSKTELQKKNDELLAEKKMAELNFLKAQMHPHFLFNTLNTLYADAIQGSGKSEEIVLRLSNLMRFILQECSKPLIRLEQEIKVIEDYVALEKLRHGDRLQIHVKVNDASGSGMISPLLLLPFVENSCKHTLTSKRGVILINVTIHASKTSVHLFVENELMDAPAHSPLILGMGISNIKRQLQLLYGSNFTFDTTQANGKYALNLTVPLSVNNANTLESGPAHPEVAFGKTMTYPV